MEIGNEISQKIRSAIKAKLVDLGAYVDDELPDYIMVMVANKKDQSQMTEDLNLFLASNTQKFTSWLHALLGKLQSITAGDQRQGGIQISEEVIVGDDLQVTEVKEEVIEPPSQADTSPVAMVTEEKAEPEEPEIKLQADDDFDEEVVDTRQVAVMTKKPTEKRPRAEPKTAKIQTVITRTNTAKSTSTSQEVSPTKVPSRSVSSGGRRRKGPTSTVGAVLKHDIEDDDEYDPLRPAIGSVASVVRAPQRRSSVPAKLQANKSLLLKAVSAAQVSVETTTKRPPAPEKVEKPRDLRERVGRRTRASIQSRLGGRQPDPQEKTTARPDQSERPQRPKRAPEPPSGEDRRYPVTETRSITVVSRSRPKVEEPGPARAGPRSRTKSPEHSSGSGKQSNSPHPEDTPGSPASPDVLDITLPDDQRLIQFSDTQSDVEADPDLQSHPDDHGHHDDGRHDDHGHHDDHVRHDDGRHNDGRHDDGHHDDGRHEDRVADGVGGEQRYIEELVESGADESEYEGEDDDESHGSLKPEVPSEICVGTAPVSPKFVVTLDGVDPDLLKAEAGSTDPDRMEEGEEYHRQGADYPRERRGHPSDRREYTSDRREYTSDRREYTSDRREYSSDRREYTSDRREYTSDRRGSPSDRRDYHRESRDYEPDRRDSARERRHYSSEERYYQDDTPEYPADHSQYPEEEGGRVSKRSHSDSYLEDTTEFETEEELGGKRSKLPERCRFWPACINGEECPFHHPSTDCINFPRCKFGDKCLYIHPRCKFDPNCTRAGCPFAHSNKRPSLIQAAAPTVIVHPIKVPVYTLKPSYKEYAPPVPPAPSHPKQITCHFFPNCTNMNCPYNHPKPCRFGLSCNQKALCLFGHPELPSKEKLRWNSKRDSLRTQIV